jgi:spermidine/putrescine transport system substrate-binding protein
VNGKIYALHKDWGTTGFVVNTKNVTEKPTSWKEFWDLTKTTATGRVMVHDYQLTTIGNALKYFGYSFNSIDEKELADAEKLLLEVKPHLFGISSDYQPGMRNGDAWMSVAWTGDGKQLHKDIPEIIYVLGKEGGEIWSDFYAVPKDAPNKKGAYALINFLLDPQVNAAELAVHGYPIADKRVIALLPAEVASDPIMYPAAGSRRSNSVPATCSPTRPAPKSWRGSSRLKRLCWRMWIAGSSPAMTDIFDRHARA